MWPPPGPDPLSAGARDAELFALKRKLVAAEKARTEATAKAQAEMRAMQVCGVGGGGWGGGWGGGGEAGGEAEAKWMYVGVGAVTAGATAAA